MRFLVKAGAPLLAAALALTACGGTTGGDDEGSGGNAEAGTCDPETEPGHRLAQLIDRLRQKLSRGGGSNDQATSAAEDLASDRQSEADSGQIASSNQSGQIEERNMAGASERRDRQETITLAPGTRDRTRW